MDVALHPLPYDLGEDGDALAQMRADLARWTPHPRRLRVHGVERTEAGPIMVTAPEPPLSLPDVVASASALHPDARTAWAVARTQEIADALGGVPSPHRAIYPKSIGFDADGHAVLYPPVFWTRAAGSWTGQATVRAAHLDWLSPEAIRGEALDARSDVYQLGLLLYRLLGAPRPFAGDGDFAMIQAVVSSTEVPRLASVGVRVPRALEDAIARAMAKRADARFASVAALAQALAPFGREDAGARRAVTEGAMRAPRKVRPPLLQDLVRRPCLKRWDELAPTERDGVRNCAECKLSVQRVTTLEALVPLDGSCVFYDPQPDE